jgi:DNA-binding MarR family transcriptional regulator
LSDPGLHDPTDTIARELVALVRSVKDLHGIVVPEGGPMLERPAFVMLMRIAEQGPLRPSALADCLFVDLSTVSRQLVTLETAGWVIRERDPDDRRAQLLHVTPEGTRVLQQNHQARREALDDLLASWPEPDRVAFAIQLSRFNEAASHRVVQNRRPAVAVAAAGPRGENR